MLLLYGKIPQVLTAFCYLTKLLELHNDYISYKKVICFLQQLDNFTEIIVHCHIP